MSSSRRSSLFKSFSWFSLNFSDRGKSSSANLLSKSFEFSRSWFNTIYHIKGFMFRSCFKTSNKEIGEKSHASVKRENICLIQSTTFCYENWKSAIFLVSTLLSFNISQKGKKWWMRQPNIFQTHPPHLEWNFVSFKRSICFWSRALLTYSI